MSLPLTWVDRIFEKLTLVYGQEFLDRWRDIDLNAVKSDWCHELAGMASSPSRIAFALANLPGRPPSVIQFKDLCRSAPAPDAPKLPEPKADPERVKVELSKLAPLRQAPSASVSDRGIGFKSIISRHEAGAKVSPTVLKMAKDGLANLGLSFANQ